MCSGSVCSCFDGFWASISNFAGLAGLGSTAEIGLLRVPPFPFFLGDILDSELARVEDWMVTLRSGFLGYACAGMPREAIPAFAGWLLSWRWLWVELGSFSGSLVGIRTFFVNNFNYN